jgi:dTDP-4-amino-4,6-dideoxygalactose transaminase
MPVPFIDLKRFESGFVDAWLAKVADVTSRTAWVGGPDIVAFEEALVRETGAVAAVGCANGTDALQLALRAAGVGPGDEVLIPDATFWATFEAVVNVGARPVTVDIDPDDLQMDFELFSRALDERRPKAAILVHLYGWGSARTAEFRALCRDRGVVLIEDGAQAWGATFQGESVYRGATFATISFYPAKVLGSCGDAGAVTCDDAVAAALVRRLGNHGRTSHYEHGELGWNSRLGGLDAAWLLLSLEHMPARLASRRAAAARYRAELPALGLKVVGPPTGWEENGYLAVALVDPAKRPVFLDALKERGIGFGTVYPGAMSEQPGAAGVLAAAYGGERARWLSRAVVNLPLFAGMREDEIAVVLSAAEAAAARAGVTG